VTSQAYYIENVLARGLDTALCTLLELKDANNPAHLYKVLACADPVPIEAELLPVVYVHPQVVLHLDLAQGGQQDQALVWAAREEYNDDLPSNDTLDMIKANPAAYESLFYPWANISPALKAVLAWPEQPMILPSFRAMVQRFLTVMNDTFQVASLHKEIFLAFCACLGVYEVDYSLKHHVLFSGPPALGKSFILQMLHRLLIPGSFQSVSYETKRANATETNMNATILTYDEVSSELFKPGVGDPELKERLSSGRTTSRVFTNKGGRRKTQVVESKQQVLFIGLTNESVHKLPDAIQSRLDVRELAHRPGKPLIALLAKKPDVQAQEAFIAETRAIQRHAAVTFTKIYLGLVPPVDLSEAYDALGRVQVHVQDYGYDISPRTMQRCVLLAKSLAVWSGTCTQEMALFTLTPHVLISASLQHTLKTLDTKADDAHYSWIVTKKADLSELDHRSMRLGNECRPVLAHGRILRAFLLQSPTDILLQAIGKVTKSCVVGWGDVAHKWKVTQ